MERISVDDFESITIVHENKEEYANNYTATYVKTGYLYDGWIYELIISDQSWRFDEDDKIRNFFGEDDVEEIIRKAMRNNFKISVTYDNPNNDILRSRIIDEYIENNN